MVSMLLSGVVVAVDAVSMLQLLAVLVAVSLVIVGGSGSVAVFAEIIASIRLAKSCCMVSIDSSFVDIALSYSMRTEAKVWPGGSPRKVAKELLFVVAVTVLGWGSLTDG